MKQRAQSVLEFTFAMVMMLFFIYGVVQTAQWTLLTVAEQTRGQKIGQGGAGQVLPQSNVSPSRPVDAVWQKK